MNTAIQVEADGEGSDVLLTRHIYFTFDNTEFEVPLRLGTTGGVKVSAAEGRALPWDITFTSKISASEEIFVRKVFAPN